jgi:hypothetical protein
MITRTEKDVRLLTDLGVRPFHIIRHYAAAFALSMAALTLIDIVAFHLLKGVLTNVLMERGLALPPGVGTLSVLLILGVAVTIVAANTRNIRRSVRRIAVQAMGS